MSQANVELVRRAIQAFNREDLRELAELSDEDLEFVSVLTAVDAGGATFWGPDTWGSYFAHVRETWDEWHVAELRVLDAGDDALAAVFHIVGRGKHSGVPVDHAIGLTYRIRHGKLWRMRSYLDPADALEAVGLPAEAMSRGKVEIVERIWRLWADGAASGDPRALSAAFDEGLLAPDSTFTPLSEVAGTSGKPYVGLDGLREFVRAWSAEWAEWNLVLEKVVATDDDRAVAVVRQSATGKRSGVRATLRWAQAFTFEGGLVTDRRDYRDPATPSRPWGCRSSRCRRRARRSFALVTAAFNSGDRAGFIAVFHPDAELHELASVPDTAVYRGRSGIEAWMESIEQAFGEEAGFEIEQLTDAGGLTLVRVLARGRGAAGGVPVEMRVFQLFEMEGAKGKRVRVYLDEAAGPPKPARLSG